MFRFIAHSGDVHPDQVENIWHFLSSWYVLIPLVLLIGGPFVLIYFVTKKSLLYVLISIGFLLLILGIFLYEKAPIVSAAAIIIGLFGSLILTLGLLSKTNGK